MKTKLVALAITAVMSAGGLMAAATTPKKTETQADLQKEAKITLAAARAVALKKAPGTVKSEELERENGRLIYSFDISTKSGITEVNVNAMDGKVVDAHHESKAKEAAEKKQEAKEKKH